MYEKIEKWLNDILKNEINSEVVALNFNLYENTEKKWSIELVGTSSFDTDDEDWACDEVCDFGTRKNPFSWKENEEWDKVLDDIIQVIKRYLDNGLYAETLKKYGGIGVGFVDGDIEILYSKP
ncbi:MAG: hypothetical protein GX275_03230 [Clostridiales bacterium]|nr:hypothetical protein [Clostridiales bacterium]